MKPDADDATKMTCAEFQAQLPELIGSGEAVSTHPHLQTCELCSALLAELEVIAQAARELFPVADPPDRLWENIQSAIQGGPESNEPERERVDAAAKDDAEASDSDLSAEPA